MKEGRRMRQAIQFANVYEVACNALRERMASGKERLNTFSKADLNKFSADELDRLWSDITGGPGNAVLWEKEYYINILMEMKNAESI